MPLNRVPAPLRQELAAYSQTLRYLDYEADQDIPKNVIMNYLDHSHQADDASMSASRSQSRQSRDEREAILRPHNLWPCPVSELGPERWTFEDEVPVIIRTCLQEQNDGLESSQIPPISAPSDGSDGGLLDFHEATDSMAGAHTELLKHRLATLLDVIGQYRPHHAPSMQHRFHPMSWWHIIDIAHGTDIDVRIINDVEKHLEDIFHTRKPKFRDNFPFVEPSRRVALFWKQQPPNISEFQTRKERIQRLRHGLGFTDLIFDVVRHTPDSTP